ncbi:hypothetical protein E1176_18020 [Fulvivirga sp. RKSG066]|uniref:AsmA-like C-terminal region-containing protein n=1 Tax=Fulvivirga aurantia TaxID=2529383 RepID=UPI0012BC48A8|nr:AsmA-like C-terminal region-containing protein [Fulvivirga aurantia]MTI22934.1 hypothetical protein [Fulvivirga aurantia]
MTLVKAIKKTFIVLLSAVLILVLSSILSAFFFKDALINHFIREANKNLNTPIDIGKITVSALDNFPRMTLTFQSVYIQESFKGSSYPLLEADQIEFTFNPLEIYRGNYTVEQIYISNASSHFKVNENGELNYIIFKKSDSTQSQTVKLDLSKVTLKDVDFKYSNDLSEIYLDVSTPRTEAIIGIVGKTYDIEAKGAYNLKKIMSQGSTLMENKELEINSFLVYDDQAKHVDFIQSELKIKGSDFITFGEYDFLETPEISFYVEGKETTLQTLISLLPEENVQHLKKYKSSGEVYLDLSLKGKIGGKNSPALQINFGLLEADLLYPERDVKITEAHAEGVFTASRIDQLNKGKLSLKNIKGMLEGQSFNGNLTLENFDDPHIHLDFNGGMEVNSLMRFIDQNDFSLASGALQVNLNMAGKINNLKKKETANKVKTSGEIDVKDLSLSHKSLALPVEKINGNFLFNNNDLAISNVSGFYGTSDFLLNGFFKNIIAYLLFENEPIGIEADLKSRFINLDELLAEQSDNKTSDYAFSISPRLMLKFNCDVGALKFRRFKPTNIKGDLKIKNQVAYTDQLKLKAMGGEIALSGLVDATKTQALQVNSNFSVERVYIDSIFYVFENFNQSFLEDKHLEGKILADVQTEMVFDQKLKLKPETLTATINTSIKDGELNNFEPMQKLARYVDEEKLDHLTFSELRNEIHVENETIYLPQMEVSSNITDIKISGTHTFDQKIEYRVIAPLRSKARIDRDEAFGAIEEDTQGRTMLYLKIIGSTDDYDILYDKESVKQKIVSDLKKEVNELKNAFKNKGLDKKKTVELEEDDYFDWDDDGL